MDGPDDARFAPLTLSSRTREALLLELREAATEAGFDAPFDERAEAVAVTAMWTGASAPAALSALRDAEAIGWESALPVSALRARSTYERLYAGSLLRDVPGWTMPTIAAVMDELSREQDARYAARVAWVLERRAAEERYPRWTLADAPDLWLSYDAVPSVVRIFGPVLPDEPIVVDGSFGMPVRSSWMIVPSDVADAVMDEAMLWARAHWLDAYELIGGAHPPRAVRAVVIEAFVRGMTISEGVDLALESAVTHSSEHRMYFECLGHLLGATTVVNARSDVRNDVLAELTHAHGLLVPVREAAERVIARLLERDAVAFERAPERDGWLRRAAEFASARRPLIPFARFKADLEVFRELGETPSAAVDAVLATAPGRPVRLPVKPPVVELRSHSME